MDINNLFNKLKLKTKKIVKEQQKAQEKQLNKTIKNLEKKEDTQLNKVNKCKQKKCSEIYKEKEKEDKKFTKEQEVVCTQKNSDKYYNCTEKFYKDSKLEQLMNQYSTCAKTKCIKEKNALRKIRQSIDVFYIKNLELYIKKIQEFQKFKLNK